jgi:tetratricopeptide (TPR) repeat protein
MFDRNRLHFDMGIWAAYAVFVSMIAPFAREPVLEVLDRLGFEKLVNNHGGTIYIAFLAATVLVPLTVVLWRSGLLCHRSHGRAVTRNKAGLALFHKGDYEGAIVEFTEAIQLDPRLAGPYANRGAALLHLNQDSEALEDLNEAIRLNPALAAALSWRGQLWSKMGDNQKALADFNAALKLEPDSAPLFARRGHVLIQCRQYERALDDFDAAITLGDTTGECFFARGSLFSDRGEYDLALRDFTEAIRIDGSKPIFYSNRGMTRMARGDLDGAIADFDCAVRQNPGDGLYLNNRGVAHTRRGNYSRAFADLKEAVRLAPAFPNGLKNLAWLLATCPDPAYRDGLKAVSHARLALELAGDKPIEWYAILAAAHAEAGDFAEAIRRQSHCIEHSPKEARADLEVRLALYKAGLPFRSAPE